MFFESTHLHQQRQIHVAPILYYIHFFTQSFDMTLHYLVINLCFCYHQTYDEGVVGF